MRGLHFLVLVVFSACSGDSNAPQSMDSSATIHNNITDTLITDNKPVQLNGCYQMTMKEDTANLRLSLQDSTVTGNLEYHLKEKDRNTGTLAGVIRDGFIYADYTFQSEGVTSVREVAFKIEGDSLVPGFGDIKEVDRKVVFTDKASLQYQHESPFLKITCTN